MESGSQVESKELRGVGGLSGQVTGGGGWISNNSTKPAADRLKAPIPPFSVLDRHQIVIVAARRINRSKIRPKIIILFVVGFKCKHIL